MTTKFYAWRLRFQQIQLCTTGLWVFYLCPAPHPPFTPFTSLPFPLPRGATLSDCPITDHSDCCALCFSWVQPMGGTGKRRLGGGGENLWSLLLCYYVPLKPWLRPLQGFQLWLWLQWLNVVFSTGCCPGGSGHISLGLISGSLSISLILP